MSNSPRSFAGLRQRMARTEPKHANPADPAAAAPLPSPTPTDSGQLPVPLRPDDMREGDHIDLRVSSESQEHRFAFEPGAPLPARSRRSAKPQAPAALPEAPSAPPVTGAEAIIASATVISPVSGTYLVSSEPIALAPIAAEVRRQEAARAGAGQPDPYGAHPQYDYRESEGHSVAYPGEPEHRNGYRTEPAAESAPRSRRAEPTQDGRPGPSAPAGPQRQRGQWVQPGQPPQAGEPVYDTRRRPAPADHNGYDGSGYGTPPSGQPAQGQAATGRPAPGYPSQAPARPAAPRPAAAPRPPAPVSPSTEPLDLRHLQGQGRPAARAAGPQEGTMRRRTDQSADWNPARPAEGHAESHFGTPAGGPARRPLGSGPEDRPGTALQLRSPQTSLQGRKEDTVTNIDIVLKEAMQIDGAVGVALVDYTSGMTLGQAGGGTLNLEVAAAGNTEVVRAKLRTMEALGLREGIEDILITLDTQYHLIRLITDQSGIGLFLYLALDKHRSNLALARRKLANLERTIEI